MRMPSAQLLAAILLSSLQWGCAGSPAQSDVRDYLDETTGASMTYLATPAVFVHGQPGLASSGRDYVYLAPLAASSGGKRSCWLWLGVWSTVDRQARDEGAGALALGTLQIVADDEPMDLETQSVDSRPAYLGRIPYSTPVAPAQEFLVQVTRTQLQRLGRARTLMLVDRPASGGAREWFGDERAVALLNQFAGEAGAPATDPVPGAGR